MYSNGTYEDAPADGFITAINAPSTGSTASSSNYVSFSADETMRIDITVPEGEINNVEIGASAEVSVDSDVTKVYSGVITSKKAISTTQLVNGNSDSSGGSQGSGSGKGGSSPGGSEGGSRPGGSEGGNRG